MSGQTTTSQTTATNDPMVSGGLLAADPEHEDWQQVFRYIQNGRTGLSGFPQNWMDNEVYENARNRNYDDTLEGCIKEYNFPISYESSSRVREKVDKFVKDKMETMFKYHLHQDGRVYSCREVKLIGYDLSRKVMFFKWTTNRSYIS